MPNKPTVPSDITNQSVMRAWYQALQVSIQSLIANRLNVIDFGAYGDGVHDDTTAFGAAIGAAQDQNKTLWLPAGRYKITSTLPLANPITITGDGSSVSTILPFLGAAGGDVFLITSSNVNLMDFGFDGTDTGTVTLTNNEFMIHANPTSGTLDQLFFKNLRFEEFDFKAGVKDVSSESTIRAAYGIKVEDTDRVIIEDCYVKNISGGFVYTTGVNFIDIHRNYIEDALLHPICIHDTTNYFNVTDNEFNPTDTDGVFLGGLIDVTSATGTQCHHGNIENNRIKGIYNTSGYVSYGAVIRVLSSTDISINNNYMTEIMDGLLNSDNDFVDLFNIKVGTYGTSSSDDNGPCQRISILNNYINGSRDTNTHHFGGILVENNYQTSNLNPTADVRITGNQLTSTAAGTSWLERGIVLNGKSSGIRDVLIEDNTIVVAPESEGTGPVGRGVISVISDDSTGKCYQIFIGGNRVENLRNSSNVNNALICIGQYTSEAFCTKPNYLKGYSYAVVIETGAGSNLWYWDDNYYEEAGANTTKFVFNVQPKSRHANFAGNTASRPTSTDYLTNYMTYFDTTLGTPLWYNGSSWVGAWGSADFAEAVSDQVGTMVTGNTEIGIAVTYQDSDNTLDFVVADTTVAATSGSTALTPGDTLTVVGATGISTSITGDTLTITGTTGAPTTAQYVTLATDGTLTNERVLTEGEGIDLTDAGAGSTITISGEDASTTNKGIASFTTSDFTVTAGDVVIKDSGIDHNSTTNYSANRHIDHTAVTLTAGEGITGGGDISASRSFALDFSDLGTTDTSIGGSDLISIHDGAQKKITWANAEASIDTVGTITTGTWSATTIAVNKGGTGQTSYTDGQLLIGNTTGNTLTKASLTAGTGISITPGSGSITIAATGGGGSGTINSGNTSELAYYATSGTTLSGLTTGNNGTLITSGTGVPSISSTLPSTVQGNITTVGTVTSGTWSATNIALNKGGTNAALTADQGAIVYSTSSALALLASTSTANKILCSGSSAAPTWSTPTFPNASATSGKKIQSDGTNWVASTSTWPTTGTQGGIVYCDSSNSYTQLAKDTNSTRYLSNTGASNSPAWAQVALTTGVSGILPIANGGNNVASIPKFEAIMSTNQSIASSTWTKIAFDSETFDVTGNYDPTTNYRFTPQVAGKYAINASVCITAGTVTTDFSIGIYKNGALFRALLYRVANVASGSNANSIACLIDMNGSTDYVEAYVFATSTGGVLAVAAYSNFNGSLQP